MSQVSPLAAVFPSWVVARDGRLVPFEADRITVCIFAAGRELGAPDAFLARELTEAVLHFGLAEWASEPPTTKLIGEVVVKVVRELGHPRLAKVIELRQGKTDDDEARPQLFAFRKTDSPEEAIAKFAARYSLDSAYSPDIARAHEEGWLVLGGLTHPGKIDAASVAEPEISTSEESDAFHDAVGGVLYLDGLPAGGPNAPRLYRQFHRPFVANLNVVHQPSLMKNAQLFDTPQSLAPIPASEEEWLDALTSSGVRSRTDWHVRAKDRDHLNPTGLDRAIDRVLRGADVCFTFDRPREPILLGEGLARGHSAVLASVGIDLLRFLDHPAIAGQVDRFLAKLPALGRMAVTAGSQRRRFLRRCGAASLRQGFRLERCRLIVCPLGLDETARRFLGSGGAANPKAREFGLSVLRALAESVDAEGRRTGLETAIDSPLFTGDATEPGALLSCHDAGQHPFQQLEAASEWHRACQGGTAAVCLAVNASVADVRSLLFWTAENTAIRRLRLLPGMG